MRLATVTHELQQPIRYVNQTGGDYFAIFTLRLTPVQDSRNVEFISEASDPHLEPWMVSAIEKGVGEFVTQREREGLPIGCLHVTLANIRIHPKDSREWAFARAAFLAMKQAFEAHETVVDVDIGTKNET